LAACLSKRLQAEKKGNVAGRMVSSGCMEDVAKYKIARSQNINKDPALGKCRVGRIASRALGSSVARAAVQAC
jgi:Golgi apparatus protein 1